MKQVLCTYPTHSLSCPPGLWVILMQSWVAQDYVCKLLCGSLSSPGSDLLDKLFGLQSSQKSFPEKAEGERNTLGEGSDIKFFKCACPPALQQPVEWWKLPDQWKSWLDYRLQEAEMSTAFFYVSSPPPSHIMGDYPRLYHLRHAVLAVSEVYH